MEDNLIRIGDTGNYAVSWTATNENPLQPKNTTVAATTNNQVTPTNYASKLAIAVLHLLVLSLI